MTDQHPTPSTLSVPREAVGDSAGAVYWSVSGGPDRLPEEIAALLAPVITVGAAPRVDKVALVGAAPRAAEPRVLSRV